MPEKIDLFKVARLDFLGGYLPSLSINYVAMSKDVEKKLSQLNYIKMKISNDFGFYCNRVNFTSLSSLTESCSFWYGLKGLFSLHKLDDKVATSDTKDVDLYRLLWLVQGCMD